MGTLLRTPIPPGFVSGGDLEANKYLVSSANQGTISMFASADEQGSKFTVIDIVTRLISVCEPLFGLVNIDDRAEIGENTLTNDEH